MLEIVSCLKFPGLFQPLPERFGEYYEAWRDGQITITQAAEKCGISRKAFYRAMDRMKQTGEYAS